jgi:uncharacterized protein
MSTFSSVVVNLLGMLVLVFILYQMQLRHFSFGKRVMTGLILGVLFGTVLQWAYGPSSVVIKQSNTWFDIVGSGYVRLLKMIVMPLIIVSIISAIINIKDMKVFGRAGTLIIAVLLITTAIAAAIGAGYSLAFHLTGEGLQAWVRRRQ